MVLPSTRRSYVKVTAPLTETAAAGALQAFLARSFKAVADCLSVSGAVKWRRKHLQSKPSKFQVSIVLLSYFVQLKCVIYSGLGFEDVIWNRSLSHQPLPPRSNHYMFSCTFVIFFPGVTLSCVTRIFVTTMTGFWWQHWLFSWNMCLCVFRYSLWINGNMIFSIIFSYATITKCF